MCLLSNTEREHRNIAGSVWRRRVQIGASVCLRPGGMGQLDAGLAAGVTVTSRKPGGPIG